MGTLAGAVARAAEADGEPPHPPFGHLLPDGRDFSGVIDFTSPIACVCGEVESATVVVSSPPPSGTASPVIPP